ncbi:MAG TPA: V-type ATP synthase subunit F [Myxococcales bacterium]|nr:V-type ATP synthase subunit F [Myxococcales bacterium]
MIALVLGSEEVVRTFALAGVEGYACETPLEAEKAAAAVREREDVALVLVSAKVQQLAAAALARLERPEGPPTVLVLPGEEG